MKVVIRIGPHDIHFSEIAKYECLQIEYHEFEDRSLYVPRHLYNGDILLAYKRFAKRMKLETC